jgi:hypothetical protein
MVGIWFRDDALFADANGVPSPFPDRVHTDQAIAADLEAERKEIDFHNRILPSASPIPFSRDAYSSADNGALWQTEKLSFPMLTALAVLALALKLSLDLFPRVADLFYGVFDGFFRNAFLLRLVANFMLLSACNTGAILLVIRHVGSPALSGDNEKRKREVPKTGIRNLLA